MDSELITDPAPPARADLILGQRIEHAQVLMLTTRLSLAQIAAHCGLADQSHLCRVFRKLTGVSPAVWRRSRVA